MFKFNQKLSALAILAVTSIAGTLLSYANSPSALAQRSPNPRSFANSCQDINLFINRRGFPAIQASCARVNGSFNQTAIPLNGFVNQNGRLVFQGDGVRSSFQESCINLQLSGDLLSAQCARVDGSFVNTRARINHIQNINGVLASR